MANEDYGKFLARQTAIIHEAAFDATFPYISYQDFVPVDTSGNQFAGSVAFISTDAVGNAAFINGNADDVPLADLDRNVTLAPVQFGAIGYGYGYDELGRAMAAGENLTAKKAIAARKAYEEFMQNLAFSGSIEKGMKGLLNQSGITPTVVTTKWASLTLEKAMGYINQALRAAGENGVITADTLIVPTDIYDALSGSVVSGTGIDGLTFAQTRNVASSQSGKQITIRSNSNLDTAGTNSTGRIVAYRNASDVVSLALPMPHQFLEAEKVGGKLRWLVPGVFRTAGVHVERAKEFVYLDNKA